MLVQDLINSPFTNLSPESTLLEVIAAFETTRQDVAPVVKDGALIGIITKQNLYRAILKGYRLDEAIQPFIVEKVVWAYPDEEWEVLIERLTEARKGHVVVIDQQRRPLGVVTKMNLIESTLSRSDRLANELASLVNNLHSGVVAIDAKGKLRTINRTAEEMLGVAGCEVIKQAVNKVLPPLAKGLLGVLYNPDEHQTQRLQLASRSLLIKYSPIVDSGLCRGSLAILNDLTDLESIAKELETTKRLEGTLEKILELAYDGVTVVGEDGNITMINAALAELVGKHRRDLLGMSADEILPELRLDEVMKSGRPDSGEVVNLNGRRCLLQRIPLIQDGRIVGAVAKVMFRDLPKLREVLNKLETMEKRLSYYREEVSRVTNAHFSFGEIISRSEEMEKVKMQAFQAASSVSTVLVLGESGTGKELFAKAIHHASGVKGNFVVVNCAAIPAELLESEFFGYVEGAFTGAKRGGKPGKFELADKGTLFLDEIGDMPLHLQSKMLRVLQEKTFERVGGTETLQVNVRIVAATNRDLQQLLREGKFRKDLYYRLNVIPVRIPPLRQRLEDIDPLSHHFVSKFNRLMDRQVTGVSPEALQLFKRHDWPGNVRELENTIERAMSLGCTTVIELEHLPEHFLGKKYYLGKSTVTTRELNIKSPTDERHSIPLIGPDSISRFDEAERVVILQALAEARGNRAKAAKLLGISRSNLYEKLKKLNIKRQTTDW